MHKHYLRHKNTKKKVNKALIKKFDKAIMVVAILVPLSNLPQLFKIWGEKSAVGVSLLSWAMFTAFTIFWLIYGLLHKEKPIIIQSFFLIFIQAGIVIGTAVYGA